MYILSTVWCTAALRWLSSRLNDGSKTRQADAGDGWAGFLFACHSTPYQWSPSGGRKIKLSHELGIQDIVVVLSLPVCLKHRSCRIQSNSASRALSPVLRYIRSLRTKSEQNRSSRTNPRHKDNVL